MAHTKKNKTVKKALVLPPAHSISASSSKHSVGYLHIDMPKNCLESAAVILIKKGKPRKFSVGHLDPYAAWEVSLGDLLKRAGGPLNEVDVTLVTPKAEHSYKSFLKDVLEKRGVRSVTFLIGQKVEVDLSRAKVESFGRGRPRRSIQDLGKKETAWQVEHIERTNRMFTPHEAWLDMAESVCGGASDAHIKQIKDNYPVEYRPLRYMGHLNDKRFIESYALIS